MTQTNQKIILSPLQVQAKDWLVQHTHALFWGEPGCGKTAIALMAIQELLSKKTMSARVWVITPKSTLVDTWLRHINQMLPKARAVVYATASTEQLSNAHFWLMTPDLLHSRLPILMQQPSPSILVWDEVTSLAGRKARYRAARTLKKKHNPTFIWGMTGTPMADSPLSLFAQAAFVTAQERYVSMTEWRYTTMNQVSQFDWVPKPGWMELVKKWLPDNLHLKAESVYKKTKTHYDVSHVPIKQDLVLLQRELRKEQMLTINEHAFVASNQAHLCLMSLHIAAGFLYKNHEHAEREVCVLSPQRVDAVVALARSRSHKCLIFSPYNYLAEELAARLESLLITGATSNRDALFKQFREDANHRFLVANPAAMAHGITLTEAKEVIWAAPCYSNQIYQQANARIQRIGQTHDVLVTNFVGCHLEALVYKALENKEQMQKLFLDYVGNRLPIKVTLDNHSYEE